MKSTILSYTTLNNLHEASHTWVNKMLDIKPEQTDAMRCGKLAHKMIQDHVSGVKKMENFNVEWDFPRIEYHCKLPFNSDFLFHGYCDGVNFKTKSFMEIKTSKSTLWSQGEFDRSMQPVYYSYVTKFPHAFFLTCLFIPQEDGSVLLGPPRKFYRKFEPEEWEKARIWAEEGIKIIQSGDYTGGLDKDTGKCLGCSYGRLCHFA